MRLQLQPLICSYKRALCIDKCLRPQISNFGIDRVWQWSAVAQGSQLVVQIKRQDVNIEHLSWQKQNYIVIYQNDYPWKQIGFPMHHVFSN